jgi:hypothetical protein
MPLQRDHSLNVGFSQDAFAQPIPNPRQTQWLRRIQDEVAQPMAEGEKAFDRRHDSMLGCWRHSKPADWRRG